jgi:hypothetical protein
MKNNNSDIFETTKQNFFDKKELSNDNFFLDDSEIVPIRKTLNTETSRRLNDYDFNLLREDAYKDVSDDVFKLEYKISKIEDELKNIESQILAARDISDYNLLDELNNRKLLLTEDYEALLAMYNDKSLSARITDSFSKLFGDKFKTNLDNTKKIINKTTENIMSKLPGPFSSFVELKKSLGKLENINKSVDELMALNIPYGENINKYEQLSKYIIKANSIQGEISRYIKNK